MTKKQIIFIHSGQAGTQIGESLWELFCCEHKLSLDGKPIDPKD